MENKLVNGDYVSDGHCGIVRQFDSEQLLARALFCLTCRRGSFPFLPELGSRLWQLKACKSSVMKATAIAYAAEAVAPLGLTVTDVALHQTGAGNITLDVHMNAGKVEVTV